MGHFLLPKIQDGLISHSVKQEHSFYVLTVQAADMDGSAEGNSATASLTIDILDVNDNIPTLEKDEVTICIY